VREELANTLNLSYSVCKPSPQQIMLPLVFKPFTEAKILEALLLAVDAG
jgi:hypothetical protein